MDTGLSPFDGFEPKIADSLYYYVTGRNEAGDLALRGIEGASDPQGPPLDGERLESKIAEFIREQKWADALSVYLLLLLNQRSDRHWWGVVKFLWRIARKPELDAYVEARGTRICAHFSARLQTSCLWLEGKHAKVGYSSVAAYAHHIKVAPSNQVLHVYERISEALDAATAEQEAMLFRHIDPTALCAPRHYGFEKCGPFVSSYYEFVAGRHVEESEWWPIEEPLLLKFWAVEPPLALLQEPALSRNIARETLARYDERLAQADVEAQFSPGELDAAKVRIAQDAWVIRDAIARVPTFVYHLDFHRGNVLLNEAGEAKVLDWERFSLEPLGFGWRAFSDEERLDDIDIDALRAVRSIPANVTTGDLMLMASLWGFYNATERGNSRLAAIWTRRLIAYLDRITDSPAG